jgi:hypothetical protein
MITPPLERIKEAKFMMNGVVYEAADPSIEAGYYSDPSNIKFLYNITSYTSKELTMQSGLMTPCM